MILHLFPCETAYSNSLLKLFDNRIQTNEHLFIFGFGKSTLKNNFRGRILNSRTLFLKNPIHLIKFLLILYFRKNWLFFHYLPYDMTLFFWRFNRRIIRKSTWIIWGGDLYAFQKPNTSIRIKLYETCRRKIIPWFPEIASFIKEDAELAMKVYSAKPTYYQILYPIPVRIEHFTKNLKPQKTDLINILVGNSGDPSNRHEEALELLANYCNENVIIYCPLSYGGSPAYIKRILEIGKNVFGNKFHPFLQLLDAEEYAKILKKVDIAIMNHQRQQGLGNILSLLYLGKKVFIRSDTTSFKFFKRNNCQVFDINDITDINFTLFSSYDEINDNNKLFAEKILSDDFSYDLWSKIINLHLA